MRHWSCKRSRWHSLVVVHRLDYCIIPTEAVPYTSESYQALIRREGMKARMSRTADCYDNAAMESFFHSFKGECIDAQSFQTRTQARCTTFEYVECFYVRSVQTKLAFTNEGMVGKGTTLDNS